MKKLLSKALGIIITIIILGVMVLGSVSDLEIIPSNAKILVDHQNQFWFPAKKEYKQSIIDASKKYEESDPGIAFVMKLSASSNDTVDYEDVSKNGKYESYGTFPHWEKGEYSVKKGSENNLLLKMIFGGDSRWNEDGTWNY